MRLILVTAALFAGCIGAPMGSDIGARTTTLNPNGDAAPNNGVNNVSFLNCVRRPEESKDHSPSNSELTWLQKNRRAGIPNKGNVDPVNDGEVTNNISFLRLC
ncbi:uncharacterized protein N7529_010589 [Penicillium soppii]|uniref:uncharacterized protein n=1 Tax=Penicillium soppii TaxID=69789 RepID=UPI002547C578|nr:uncharacterized protein N7529_010589 [Penicillium soppii]KAJ5856645.1 hypothetical protein N7529_010589 [Penicillium soppii]